MLARESFTPFGARRSSNWQESPSPANYAAFADVTPRGFTGHEMLDAVSLIHMNGRVYDPGIGRFLSADPIIQTIALSQALNPFAYVLNILLTLIDPSGYSFLGKLFHAIGHFFKRFFRALLHDLNVIVGYTLVIVGTITMNAALVTAGIYIMRFPVHLTYRSGRVGVGFGYTFNNVPVSTGPLWTPGGSSAPPPNWISGGPGVIAGVPVLYVNAAAQSAGNEPASRLESGDWLEYPEGMRKALEEIFGEGSTESIEIIYRPWYVHLHGIFGGSVTRPERIYTDLTPEQFFGDEFHTLHEHYHVIRQWRTGELTRRRYLWEGLKEGRGNQFEREADDFARTNQGILRRKLGR